MRQFVPRLLFVCAVGLSFFLVIPLFHRGMSWVEAGMGILPCGAIGMIMMILYLRGAGQAETSSTDFSKRPRGPWFWSVALVWSLMLGGLVLMVTSWNYQDNLREAGAIQFDNHRNASSRNLNQIYAKYDRIGMVYGAGVLGFSLVAAVGLITGIARRGAPRWKLFMISGTTLLVQGLLIVTAILPAITSSREIRPEVQLRSGMTEREVERIMTEAGYERGGSHGYFEKSDGVDSFNFGPIKSGSIDYWREEPYRSVKVNYDKGKVVGINAP